MESITWIQRRGQIKHLLYELCLTGRIDRATLAEQFKDLNSVEPVKHGRNLSADYPSLFECSVCGYVNDDTYSGCPHIFTYCPNCGATMDGEEE